MKTIVLLSLTLAAAAQSVLEQNLHILCTSVAPRAYHDCRRFNVQLDEAVMADAMSIDEAREHFMHRYGISEWHMREIEARAMQAQIEGSRIGDELDMSLYCTPATDSVLEARRCRQLITDIVRQRRDGLITQLEAKRIIAHRFPKYVNVFHSIDSNPE